MVTRVDVGFCAFPPSAAEVNVLPTRESGSEANADVEIVTSPSETRDIIVITNDPITSSSTLVPDSAPEETDTETPELLDVSTTTSPENNTRREPHDYRVGAKVAADWKGRGTYYPAVVTGVHTAGAKGARTTYDVVYEVDGEPESTSAKIEFVPEPPRTSQLQFVHADTL